MLKIIRKTEIVGIKRNLNEILIIKFLNTNAYM